MRNLQKSFFLGLFGMLLAAGCTITTSDGGGNGGESGNWWDEVGGTTAKGGATATGGTTTTGGTNATGGVAGTTTTTPAFTTANCAAAATTVPASIPDVTTACIACMYGANGCADAVACENKPGCMATIRAVLECNQLYYLYNTEVVVVDDVDACQGGSLTAPPAGADQVTVKSSDPKAWNGAEVSTTEEMDMVTTLSNDCTVACRFDNQ